MVNTAYEKLGAFYLGREYDLARGSATDQLVLYDSKDLITHAVCVGMTGSGKTGLCIGLLEEAAIDGIPAIVIDPKGDLVDLALTFPNLDAKSFRPWVSEDAARQQGISIDEFAAHEADKWKKGLAEWGQDAARIQRLRDAAEVVVYTPGSDAAAPVSVLSSLELPMGDTSSELLAERASGVASSLLSLLGVDADPVRSREHILLTTILQSAWSEQRSLDLAGLVHAVQSPPVARVGVMELESFFPSKERFQLAMSVNNLLAAPRFQSFLVGAPIQIDRMLYDEKGKPRIAIFSVAHLDDAERMFFVSLLLNEIVAWTRTRSGTSSLRAIVYMDEVFGYLPPVGEPPSKRPLLTLLKQARAFGVGVVLATQNPVDLDYKALSNAGTWFIGRLQTERDKKRLADGLASSAASIGGDDLEKTIGALASRVFLLHNTHESKPVVFQTRWTLSYLAGPLTREQIRRLPGTGLQEATRGAGIATADSAKKASSAAIDDRRSGVSIAAPVLPPDLPQRFQAGASSLAPFALGMARVHVPIPGGGIHTQSIVRLAPLSADSPGPDWSAAADIAEPSASDAPPSGVTFAALPASAGQAGTAKKWNDAFADSLYRGATVQLFECVRLRLVSKPGESERDFRIRIADVSRVDRDAKVEQLRDQYAAKLATLEDRIRRAGQAVAREKDQASSQRVTAAMSAGATLLSAFLGRKVSRTAVGDAARSVRGFDRAAKQGRDVDRAQDSLAVLEARRAELERELAADVAALEAKLDPTAEPLTTVTVRPRKSDVEVTSLVVLWRPA